ncbi:hypothetical protein BKA69DRAFT_1049541 [Paraphysoderma sedebokerense]|nr:hypothetical protein BKA69DRAFT_1049541 [Paraphysoderma sedebokerense]
MNSIARGARSLPFNLRTYLLACIPKSSVVRHHRPLASLASFVQNQNLPPSSQAIPHIQSLNHAPPQVHNQLQAHQSASTLTLSQIQSLRHAFRSFVTSPNHYSFDTYRMVRHLERNGFTRGQAVAIMRAMHAILADSSLKTRSEMLVSTDLENETYLYKAALSELRTELKVVRQNDYATVKSETDSISREIDSLNQRLRDDISNLKSDIQIDMNNRKSEIREEAKLTEFKVQEVNNKLTVLCSDIKTDIETMKLETTKVVSIRLFLGAVLTLFFLSTLNSYNRQQKERKELRELKKFKAELQSRDIPI